MNTGFDFLGFEASNQLKIYANLGLAELVSQTLPMKVKVDAYLIANREELFSAKICLQLPSSQIKVFADGRDPISTLNAVFQKMHAAFRKPRNGSNIIEFECPSYAGPGSRRERSSALSQNWDKAARANTHKRRHHQD